MRRISSFCRSTLRFRASSVSGVPTMTFSKRQAVEWHLGSSGNSSLYVFSTDEGAATLGHVSYHHIVHDPACGRMRSSSDRMGASKNAT